MRKIKTRDFLSISLTLFLASSSFLAIMAINLFAGNVAIDSEDKGIDPIPDDLMVSDTFQVGSKYALSEWWNTTYRYRIGIEVEEVDGIDRYEPVEVDLEFAENEFYEGTGRIVAYNGPGDWSDPLPVQIWNAEKFSGTDFINNCTIVFIAICKLLYISVFIYYY